MDLPPNLFRDKLACRVRLNASSNDIYYFRNGSVAILHRSLEALLL